MFPRRTLAIIQTKLKKLIKSEQRESTENLLNVKMIPCELYYHMKTTFRIDLLKDPESLVFDQMRVGICKVTAVIISKGTNEDKKAD